MSGATAKRSTALVAPSVTIQVGTLLQRKCACGSSKSPMGQTCDQCQAHGLQAKLAVGTSDDPLEHEADRVADQVLAGPAQEKPRSSPLRIQRYSARVRGQDASSAPASVDRALASSGRPLDAPLRRDMESRFGHDFSQVRIHTGDAANRSARDVNAYAYTVGQHVVMGPSAASPSTTAGRRLLAHELVHTIQQRSSVNQVQRWKAPVASIDNVDKKESSANPPEAFLQAGWRDVNDLGIAYKEGDESAGGGVNLRESPGGKLIEWLPHNTKVMVLKANDKQGALAVMVKGGKSTFGYVSQDLIMVGAPDPESDIYKVKFDDTSLGIARAHYGGKGFNDAWYADQRYVVNALYWANRHQKKEAKGGPSIVKKDTVVKVNGFPILFQADSDDAPWQTVHVIEGKYLWLPGVEFLRSLYGVVRKKGGGTGSIKAEVWQTIKGAYEKVAYVLAFIGGVVHGFLKSIWDAIAGIAELLFSFLKSLFSGDLLSDAKKLGEAVSGMTWDGIKEAIGNWADKWHAKLTDDSPWVRGHAHGYLTGYVMAEAAMMLISGGALTELKAIAWGSKLGTAMKASRAFQALEKSTLLIRQGINMAGGPAKNALDAFAKTRVGKAVVKTVVVTAKVTKWTVKWLGEVLNLPATILTRLSEPLVKKLMKVEKYFPRIKAYKDRIKKWLLGCHSPCDCDADFIEDIMKLNLSEDELHRRAMAAARKDARAEEIAERARKAAENRKAAATKPAVADPAPTAKPKDPAHTATGAPSAHAWDDPALAEDVALAGYKRAGVKKPLSDDAVRQKFKEGYRFDPDKRKWRKPHKSDGGRPPRASTEPFMKDSLAKITDPTRKKPHPLHRLTEPNAGGGGGRDWRKTTRVTKSGKSQTGRFDGNESGAVVQAGHPDAYASGSPQRYVLEDADLNQLSGQTIESKGAFSYKVAVEVEGVPVDLASLQQWERLGVVDPGTVAKATAL